MFSVTLQRKRFYAPRVCLETSFSSLSASWEMGAGLYGCACYTGVTRIIGNIDIRINEEVAAAVSNGANPAAATREAEQVPQVRPAVIQLEPAMVQFPYPQYSNPMGTCPK